MKLAVGEMENSKVCEKQMKIISELNFVYRNEWKILPCRIKCKLELYLTVNWLWLI